MHNTPHTEETKKLISKRTKEAFQRPEVKEKLRREKGKTLLSRIPHFFELIRSQRPVLFQKCLKKQLSPGYF